MKRQRSTFIFVMPFRVKRESDSILVVETASGRNLLLFGVILWSAFWGSILIFFACLACCLLVWTFREVWTFGDVIKRERFLLGITLQTTAILPDSIRFLTVIASEGTRQVDSFALSLDLFDGRQLQITSRPRLEMLDPTIQKIRSHLPDHIAFEVRYE